MVSRVWQELRCFLGITAPGSFNRVLELAEKEFEGLQWDHFDRKKFVMAPICYWPSDVPLLGGDLDQVLVPPCKGEMECNYVSLPEQPAVTTWHPSYWYMRMTIEELVEDIPDIPEHVPDDEMDVDGMDVDEEFGTAEPRQQQQQQQQQAQLLLGQPIGTSRRRTTVEEAPEESETVRLFEGWSFSAPFLLPPVMMQHQQQ